MPRKRQPAGAIPQRTLAPGHSIHPAVLERMEIHDVPPHLPDDTRADLGMPRDTYLFRLTLDAPLDD